MTNTSAGRRFRLGLIINPFAGIGGALALKGSDGAEVRTRAMENGGEQLAMQKASLALKQCLAIKDQLTILTGNGDMGENAAKMLGFEYEVMHRSDTQTESKDTQALASKLLDAKVDLILFAGGDGTARNLCNVVSTLVPVLGIPAGCKIHSGVYAITPKSAGIVLRKVIEGELLSLHDGEVRDIDETLFRQGKVMSKHYGEMKIPSELTYIQAVKMGGKESDELLLDDISDYVLEIIEDFPETFFVMGSGSTVDAIMQQANLPNTLLGVDIVKAGKVIAQDVTARELLSITAGKDSKLVATIIGGQGHILGRGNQQLSPMFIKQIGKQNIILVATKAKLHLLGDKGLISDSGDTELDDDLAGPISVITGYRDQVLYFVRH
ncbi:MAG: putative polyphosphate/ATP-dependent NAD kinase [Kangiellaceae bacterium]|jgi:predicted polyphosphate/ATP-dependent NAD kinase